MSVQKDEGHKEGKKKRSGKSSASTKRSRAAAIHNQSERVLTLYFYNTKHNRMIYIQAKGLK